MLYIALSMLIMGLILLLVGANYLVDSSVALAQRAKISNFVIGLTIVGMGTSAPELFVSISAALNGSGDVALGNVIGSNICNVLLILGITATIFPFAIERTTYRRDIPFAILATLLVIIVANYSLFADDENTISRFDAALLLAAFAGYMAYVIIKERQPDTDTGEETTSSLAGNNAALLVMTALFSLVALIVGGNMLVGSAEILAMHWGMSEAAISITVIAVGTSLPELITSVVAALKKNTALALGNVIGSSIFNLLFILGISGIITPIKSEGISMTDYAVLLLSVLLTFITVFTFKRRFFDRIEGIIFLVIYILYTTYLITQS